MTRLDIKDAPSVEQDYLPWLPAGVKPSKHMMQFKITWNTIAELLHLWLMSDDSYKLTIMDVYNGWFVFIATVTDVQVVGVHSSRRNILFTDAAWNSWVGRSLVYLFWW